MAAGNFFGAKSDTGQTMQVFIPSSAPIVSSISIDSLMGHF